MINAKDYSFIGEKFSTIRVKKETLEKLKEIQNRINTSYLNGYSISPATTLDDVIFQIIEFWEII